MGQKISKSSLIVDIILIALRVLNERIIVILSMIMSFVLFLLAYISNQHIALYGAVAFAVLVFIPTLFKTYKKEPLTDAEQSA